MTDSDGDDELEREVEGESSCSLPTNQINTEVRTKAKRRRVRPGKVIMSDSESELGSDTGKRHVKLTDSDKDSATESDSGAETGEVQPVGVPCPPFCFLF